MPKPKRPAAKPTKTWPFEQKLAPLVGPILLLVMVAVSAFLLGRSYQSHLTLKTPPPAGGSADSTSTGNASAIDSIQSAIAGGASAPASPSTPSSPTTSAAAKSSAPTGLININTADLAALETLSGIGATKGQAIIDYRTQNGPFTSIDELDNVKGIGPATISKIRSQITI